MKPIFSKISIILFLTKDIGCLEPILIESPGLVRSLIDPELIVGLETLEIKSSTLLLASCFNVFSNWPTSFLSLLSTFLNS